MIDCEHLKSGTCDVATSIAGCSATVRPEDCRLCLSNDHPRCDNSVTFGIAARAYEKKYGSAADLLRRRSGRLMNPVRLSKILDGSGVGSNLWRLLESIGIRHTANCPCLEWAERMNVWGPIGCRLARKEIVDHMRSSSSNYGWGDIAIAVVKVVESGLARRLSVTDPYGSLLDEAIRTASRDA